QKGHHLLDPNFRATLVSKQQQDTVLHIHPVLDGCLSYNEGVFQPQSAQDFARLRVPYDECSLNGSLFKVLVNHAPPFCSLIRYGEDDDFVADYSMEIQFLKLLQERFNFEVQLFDGRQSPYML